MVEIKSKKSGKTLAMGEIVKETEEAVKVHSSYRLFKKKDIEIQYIIAMAMLLICFASCKTKVYTAEQLERIRVTDSIAKAEKALRMMDIQEELDDRDPYDHK